MTSDYDSGYRDGTHDAYTMVLYQVADILNGSPASWREALDLLKEMKEKAWMYDGLTK